MSDKTRQDEKGGTSLKDRVVPPKRFKVILLNDDFTSMEFVVLVLTTVFRHGQAGATRIMLSIHKTGVGTAGVYTKDVAETKLEQVHAFAREAGFPLQGTTEPE